MDAIISNTQKFCVCEKPLNDEPQRKLIWRWRKMIFLQKNEKHKKIFLIAV